MKNNKISKILIIKLRNSIDILPIELLVKQIKDHAQNIQIDVALGEGVYAPTSDISFAHTYSNKHKNSFFKSLFYELKFIFRIKKGKYQAAILTHPGNQGVIIAKYAKIKKIAGFIGKDEKANKLITHPVVPSRCSTEDDIKKILNELDII